MSLDSIHRRLSRYEHRDLPIEHKDTVNHGVGAGGYEAVGTRVMVRAAMDEPMASIAVAVGRAVVEIASPNPEKHASVGVPRRRVFARDEGLLRELRASYEQGDVMILSALWMRATAPDLSRLPARDAAT